MITGVFIVFVFVFPSFQDIGPKLPGISLSFFFISKYHGLQGSKFLYMLEMVPKGPPMYILIKRNVFLFLLFPFMYDDASLRLPFTIILSLLCHVYKIL